MSSMVLLIFSALMSVGLMERPSSLAKVGWMALTLLPESKSANTDFCLKLMGYWIHGTYGRLDHRFSSTASSLVTFTDMEVVKTDTIF